MYEAVAVVIGEPGHLAPELVAAQQQLSKVDDTGAPAALLVTFIEPDQLPAGRIAAVVELTRAQALVLLRVDEPRDLARHPARLVEVQRAHELAHEPLLVLRI
jgi:hypothetical protein